MRYYFAPMECITGYVYRNAHRKYFTQADKYFSPFIVPGKGKRMNRRETEDVLAENNRGLFLVPQILTNSAEDFLETAGLLREYGYREINLNLGCPSKGVAAKGRGAGFLRERARLEAFLDRVFEKSPAEVSVKTRLGMEEPEEFLGLMELFNRFPIKELIIHPRIQRDYYRKPLRMEWFRYAVEHSKVPLCYNGDLFFARQIEEWVKDCPKVESVMMGRGLAADPALIGEARGIESLTKEKLLAFIEEIYQGYLSRIGEPGKVLPKMKELWYYTGHMFIDHGETVDKDGRFFKECGKERQQAYGALSHWLREIKRAGSLKEYEGAVEGLSRTAERLRESLPYFKRGVLEGGRFRPPGTAGTVAPLLTEIKGESK